MLHQDHILNRISQAAAFLTRLLRDTSPAHIDTHAAAEQVLDAARRAP